MTIRFFRRVRLAPGLTLNLSKRGASVSVGPRGAKITAGTSGVRRTVGLPGTGLWYTERATAGARQRSGSDQTPGAAAAKAEHRAPRAADRLDPGFFRRLFIPKAEEHFVDGMRHASFMAGMFALKAGHYEEAIGSICVKPTVTRRGVGVMRRGHTQSDSSPKRSRNRRWSRTASPSRNPSSRPSCRPSCRPS